MTDVFVAIEARSAFGLSVIAMPYPHILESYGSREVL
jgi:hypothetical protein